MIEKYVDELNERWSVFTYNDDKNDVEHFSIGGNNKDDRDIHPPSKSVCARGDAIRPSIICHPCTEVISLKEYNDSV